MTIPPFLFPGMQKNKHVLHKVLMLKAHDFNPNYLVCYWAGMYSWLKVQNFKKPELSKFKS